MAPGRRMFLWVSAGAAISMAAPGTNQEVADLAGDLAGALADNDAEAFLVHVAKSMPQRTELRDSLLSLLNGANVTSSVEILELTESAGRVQASLDWQMRVQSREATGPLDQRRETVKLELERQGKKWRIVALTPIAFFRPQRVR